MKMISPLELKKLLEKHIPSERISLEEKDLDTYSIDETKNISGRCDIVVFAKSPEEISSVLKICNTHGFPVITRGKGSGVTGGAVPVDGGLILSLERMNQIIEIDPENMVAVVESGAITLDIQKEAMKHGLMYPPDPASSDKCSIGGNIAESAGGPRAVKYGTTKDYILGVEFVTADGSIMRHGGKFVKNATGFNLTGIIIGSEGTLCVVTKVFLKLIPAPIYSIDILLAFNSMEDAIDTVFDITKSRIIPSTIEFLEENSIKIVSENKNIPFPEAKAHLIVQLDGPSEEDVNRSVKKIKNLPLVKKDQTLIASDEIEKSAIWEGRKGLRDSLAKKTSTFMGEDCAVPRSKIPQFIRDVKKSMETLGLETVMFGHAGDGNVHINVLKGEISDEDWPQMMDKAKSEIYKSAIKHEGTISGEHGIGALRKKYLGMAHTEQEINLMKKIKAAFDPKNILNPGKIF